MKNNFLYFECRGMNDNKIPGDIKNHRIDILEKIDIVFEGKPYKMFFEFTTGTRFNYRKTHKITGKPLKHIVKECINNNGLWTDTQFEQPEVGRYWDEKSRCWKTYNYESSWRLTKLDRVSHDENLSFCKRDILNLVNRFSVKKYSGIIIIEEEATNIINHTGGFREKDILAHDPYFKKGDTWTDDHKIVEVYSHQKDYSYSCQVDLITGKITG